MSRRAVVWVAFVLVHAVVIWLGFVGRPRRFVGRRPAVPVVGAGARSRARRSSASPRTGSTPQLALVPIVRSARCTRSLDYTLGWGLLVTALDAAAFAVLVGRGRSRGRLLAAWFWLAAILALGGVGMFRLDAVTVPLAVAGLAVARRSSVARVGAPRGGDVDQGVAGGAPGGRGDRRAPAARDRRRRGRSCRRSSLVVVVVAGGGAAPARLRRRPDLPRTADRGARQHGVHAAGRRRTAGRGRRATTRI